MGEAQGQLETGAPAAAAVPGARPGKWKKTQKGGGGAPPWQGQGRARQVGQAPPRSAAPAPPSLGYPGLTDTGPTALIETPAALQAPAVRHLHHLAVHGLVDNPTGQRDEAGGLGPPCRGSRCPLSPQCGSGGSRGHCPASRLGDHRKSIPPCPSPNRTHTHSATRDTPRHTAHTPRPGRLGQPDVSSKL